MATANIDKVRTGLAEMRTIIAREETRRQSIQQDLGDALAAATQDLEGRVQCYVDLTEELERAEGSLQSYVARAEELARAESSLQARQEDAETALRV